MELAKLPFKPDAAYGLMMAQHNSKAAIPMVWGWPAVKYCRLPPDGLDLFQSAATDGIELAYNQILLMTY